MSITRRHFLKSASLLGASLAFNDGGTWQSAHAWHERRDLYPEGVASGDPRPDSVVLWTRRPPVNGDAAKRLTVEIAEDEGFARVVASAQARLTDASDWTCRVLAGGLHRRVFIGTASSTSAETAAGSAGRLPLPRITTCAQHASRSSAVRTRIRALRTRIAA